MATPMANVQTEAPSAVIKETDKFEPLRFFLPRLIEERFCNWTGYEDIQIAQLADNLAFIATSRLGRDTTLDHFKFSQLLGGGRLYLMYGESLILKGASDGEPGNAVIGLFEQSMEVIEDCMENTDHTWWAFRHGDAPTQGEHW